MAADNRDCRVGQVGQTARRVSRIDASAIFAAGVAAQLVRRFSMCQRLCTKAASGSVNQNSPRGNHRLRDSIGRPRRSGQ